MKLKRFFPWRLYRKFFVSLFASVFLLSCLGLLLLAKFSGVNFSEAQVPEALAIFALLAGLLSSVLAYQFTVPLRRVILKAWRMANKRTAPAEAFEEVDLTSTEPGEYFELEKALDGIQGKLRHRRVQLAHEREESQALMSAMQQSVVTVSMQEKLQTFNASFATQFMSRELLEAHGQGRLVDITEVFRDPLVLDLFQKSLALQQVCRGQVAIKSRIDEIDREFAITVSPLREERSREVYGVLGLFHDITELVLAEKIRIEFVENASHELRTPLTSVKGFVETLKEDLLGGKTAQAAQFLSIISKNVDRLTDLVNDMLTISSLEHSSPMQLELLDPAKLTTETIEDLSSLAMEKNILIKSAVTCKPFRADESKIRQVLINLTSNAIKYIGKQGLIEIFWEESAIDQGVILRVKDNGPGIAEEHLDRLFERFYRIDKGRSRDAGGTGLGLAIVKHIVQAHGGTVNARSKLGQGAEFICEFPRSSRA